jgi:hypothetical protein
MKPLYNQIRKNVRERKERRKEGRKAIADCIKKQYPTVCCLSETHFTDKIHTD